MSTMPPPPPPQTPAVVPPPVDPAQEISGPATGILITGILGGSLALFSLLANMLGFGLGSMMAEGPEEQMAQWISGGFAIASSAIGLIVAGFLIYASLEMKKLNQWGLAVGASIIAMVPCVSPCCLLGLPIGIWSLIVLQKPPVKAAFR